MQTEDFTDNNMMNLANEQKMTSFFAGEIEGKEPLLDEYIKGVRFLAPEASFDVYFDPYMQTILHLLLLIIMLLCDTHNILVSLLSPDDQSHGNQYQH